MAVDPADLEALRRLELTSEGGSDLSPIETVSGVYGWLIASARSDGRDEADDCELFARHSEATAPEVRAIAATLRRLGYTVAADRLREIAGQRKHDLKPL